MMEWVFKLAHPKSLYTNSSWSIGFIVPSLLHVLLCFVLLGISASEYLCPNVAQLTDSGSGGTGSLMAVLLSWCNSSPDLFSNLLSWTSTDYSDESMNAAALSIGEVLGACGIILCIVIGSICIIMSSTPINFSHHQRMMILRDLGFVSVALSLMWYICIRHRVTLLNCLLMIMVYVLYLVMKFTFRSSSNDEDDAATLNEQEPLGTNRIKPSIISAMDINNLLSILENSNNLEDNNEAELVSMNQEIFNMNYEQLGNLRPSTEPLRPSKRIELTQGAQSSPMTFQPYSDDPEITRDISNDRFIVPNNFNRRRKLQKIRIVIFEIFTPHLLNFRQKSFIDALLSILTVPFAVLLRLSCPQPSNELDYDEANSRYVIPISAIFLLFVQSALCPIISFILISCLLETNFSLLYWIFPMTISAASVAFMLSFYNTLLSYNKFSLLEPSADLSFEQDIDGEMSEERRMVEKLGNFITTAFLSIGIFNVILWISLIANSLIEMLDIYQKITHISQGILGLTIFAWGNSISDLISNIAMCRLYRKMPANDYEEVKNTATKFFMISCTSCLGGVLLNSMGGIGVSGLIAMSFVHKSSDKWWIFRFIELKEDGQTVNYKFIVSCIALSFQILLLAVIFGSQQSIHEWIKKNMKPIGLGMCCLWGLATLCNVFLEIFL
ncbi:hypothetical protein HG535_0C00600 [Zygotorulaspora mrakii]|uniref:Sodium/calcium exchanger membrane region domain-containing protein n=1 Tax=Zygotorulaspora mrakii TaxID=42260 RepID=A0A7H9AZF4_ZYGMR|nr:uncharacterized protein HG535_0C00600 [Zygotorulaspora mrakii]QLG71711.1 hypothetical protein HG535_0C00600 [Zygotorulaspora mrakii]